MMLQPVEVDLSHTHTWSWCRVHGAATGVMHILYFAAVDIYDTKHEENAIVMNNILVTQSRSGEICVWKTSDRVKDMYVHGCPCERVWYWKVHPWVLHVNVELYT